MKSGSAKQAFTIISIQKTTLLSQCSSALPTGCAHNLRKRKGASERRDYFETPHDRVGDLATHVGRSVRTLHRRIKASTGLAPKRFLTMQRFRRAVHDIATQNIGLSLIASDLGFSDQAHLSREFRRHAGVSPGAFKQAWRGRDARAVRFLQDTGSGTRLRLAVWSNEVSPDSI